MDQLDEIRQAITRHAGDSLTATTLPDRWFEDVAGWLGGLGCVQDRQVRMFGAALSQTAARTSSPSP